MTLKTIASSINDFLEKWMSGRDKERPDLIKIENNVATIQTTDSIRRFSNEKLLTIAEIKKMTEHDRRKIGIILGDSIAKDLTITFETKTDRYS